MLRTYSISEVHRQFEDGSLDPECLAKSIIATVERLNPLFHAWVCFDPDALTIGAESVRELLRQKIPLRKLEGIPVGVKDVFNTLDFPTQMGSEIWRGFTPGNDARVVYYLKNSGALIAGKTVTAEFAVHALNETLNPHNFKLTPGSSSSGSAVAVALGMAPVALGTQTGGSIIRPASFCGVYGFKPSFGLIPRTGSLKTTDSLDTIGFFASHPSDLRPVLDVLRVDGPNFPLSFRALKDLDRQSKPKNRPWKIGLVKTHTWVNAPEYAKNSLLKFAHKLSSQKEIDLVEVELPSDMGKTHEVHSIIYEKSLSYYFKNEHTTHSKVSPIMNKMIERGQKISTEKYHAALEFQNILIEIMDEHMKSFDALICLSTAGSAPLREITENPDSALMWTMTHLPSISAPVFKSPTGEPFGLQIIGRKYNDHLLTNLIEYLISIELIPQHPYPKLNF